tara:strand:- start:162 stop:272 length:111 start_codon:yes stop_codon:yes gene_type:complete
MVSEGILPSQFAQKKLMLKDEIDWYDIKETGLEGKG